ncbi:MAG: hypothetical protein HY594_02980 [Candidatus Omnitrophica bacterium]|nr:hypothetical protein [Candidatus Omnitrophota bacterium]
MKRPLPGILSLLLVLTADVPCAAGSEGVVSIRGAVQMPLEQFTIPAERLDVSEINLVSDVLAVAGHAVVGPAGSALIDVERMDDFDLVVYLGYPEEKFREGTAYFLDTLFAYLKIRYGRFGLVVEPGQFVVVNDEAVNTWFDMKHPETGKSLPVRMLLRSPRCAQFDILDESRKPAGGFNPLTPYFALGENEDVVKFFEQFSTVVYPEETLAESLLRWYVELTVQAYSKRSWPGLAMAAYASGDLDRARELMAESGDFDAALKALRLPPDFLSRIRQIRSAAARPGGATPR